LCSNAIHYSDRGDSALVTVRDFPDHALLTVSDNGIGIPEEDLDRIFERFYRVDKSHSKEVGGTGLGLSIVKHAAKVHDAEISVKSKLGKGSVFTVKFPKNSKQRISCRKGLLYIDYNTFIINRRKEFLHVNL
jgi:two-component system phosphate regulon sensor histidine kinase PhoR